MDVLTEFYQDRAAQFLKTVVCFDDQAYEDTHDGTVLTASLPDSGFDDESTTEQHLSKKEEPGNAGTSLIANRLDEKHLTGAFADKGILCSVIKTENNAKAVKQQILSMSKSADIMLLDWQLENLGPTQQKTLIGEIIYTILQEDENAGGRLRLIVIFSGEKENAVLSDLSERLEDLRFTLDSGNNHISKGTTKIVFIGKPGGASSDAVRLDNYTDLPEKVIAHFTSLISGILPVTAVSAISAIREQTHHLLAKFPAELDHALVAHKCLIPDPDDAAQYLTNLISDAISVLVSEKDVSKALSSEKVAQWLEMKFGSDHKDFSWLKAITSEYQLEKIELINKYRNNKLGKSKTKKTVLETLSVCEESHTKMSILTKVLRSCVSDVPNSAPDLTMGVVVATSDDEYLLCIQPLCDSVRIKSESTRKFPFLPLTQIQNFSAESPEPPFPDLCLPDINGNVWCKVDRQPMHLIVHAFSGGQSGCVQSRKDKNRFFFDTAGEEAGKALSFRWVADLKIPFVQRISSGLAERMHTLGVDDYEVLRAG